MIATQTPSRSASFTAAEDRITTIETAWDKAFEGVTKAAPLTRGQAAEKAYDMKAANGIKACKAAEEALV